MRGILDEQEIKARFTPTRIFWAGGTLVLLVLFLLLGGRLFEHLDAKQLMVVQYPTGTLVIHTQPGYKMQWFGTVTKYAKRGQFWFSAAKDQGKEADQSISVRFNDGGHAKISGSIAWEMPVAEKDIIKLHTLYGSYEAVEHQLVRTIVEKAVYMTGPLMSSKESYAERRNELINFISDQINHGIYKTEVSSEKQKDPITGVEKTVMVVRLVREQNNLLARQDQSPLEEFKIKTFNLSINEVRYDPTVENQIKQQQEMTMQVQTAIAEAKKAEQAALTAEQNGKAEAAKAKWEQEVVKAREVTAAEARLKVAQLDTQSAEQGKRKSIFEGEGEATKRQLIMNADGALDKKLQAYIEVQKLYADAIKNYQGDWVPNVVMGGGGASQVAGSGATALVDLLSAKTAMELGLDIKASGRAKTQSRQQ